VPRDSAIGTKPPANTYSFTESSEKNFANVHPDLVKLARKALELSPVNFGVSEGARSVDRQRYLLGQRATQTLDSRHIPAEPMGGGNNLSHAIDIFPFVGGEARYDGRLFAEIKEAWDQASVLLKIPFEWGGDWKDFHDAPHFQLPVKEYPPDKALEK